MPSNTSRTLKQLRKLGWQAQVVERWNGYARKRIDLFGCIDILACYGNGLFSGQSGILGVQTCSGGDHATRMTKALKEPKLKTWLESGGKFEVWSWRKYGPRGRRKIWKVRRQAVVLHGYKLHRIEAYIEEAA